MRFSFLALSILLHALIFIGVPVLLHVLDLDEKPEPVPMIMIVDTVDIRELTQLKAGPLGKTQDGKVVVAPKPKVKPKPTPKTDSKPAKTQAKQNKTTPKKVAATQTAAAPEPSPAPNPEPKPAPKPTPKPAPDQVKPKAAPKPVTKPDPPKPPPEPKPAPPKPAPKKAPAKPAEKPKPTKKKESLDDFASSMLNTLEKVTPKEKSQPPVSQTDLEKTVEETLRQFAATSSQPTLADKLSVSEIDAIRAHITQCWNVPAGARGVSDMYVTLRLAVSPTGDVLRAELDQKTRSRMRTDTFYRTVAESAERAVRACGALPVPKSVPYNVWRTMTINMDPNVGI
jgi:outer membrane biosynthesis protein TonB